MFKSDLLDSSKLTNLQLELLQLFPFNTSDEELMDIKKILSNYYADKAASEMDRLWDQNHWTNETMDRWLQEHK